MRLGNGDGTFSDKVSYSSNGGLLWGTVLVADVNTDAKPDIIDENSNDGTLALLLGNGDGTFQSAVTFASGGFPVSVAVADVNGDGRPDLVAANACLTDSCSGAAGVLLNNTGPHSPTVTTLASSPNPVVVNQMVTYTATVKNETKEAVAGTVMFQDGTSIIATVPVGNYQGAYTTKYKTPGAHSITAVYSGDLHNAGSTSAALTEHVRGTSKTSVITSGSPSLIGRPVTFTVTVTSTYGTIPDAELVNLYDGKTSLGSANRFIGYADLLRNWLSLVAAAGLSQREFIEAQSLFAARIGFFGPPSA